MLAPGEPGRPESITGATELPLDSARTTPCVKPFVLWLIPSLRRVCDRKVPPLSGFQALPDLTYAHVASFLPTWDLDSLASTSRFTRARSEFSPSSRVLARGQGLATELPQHHSAALGRLLSTRGGGACKELTILHAWAVDAFNSAFSGGMGRHLTALILVNRETTGTFTPSAIKGQVDPELLSPVLPLLPGLHRLVLHSNAKEGQRWAVVWYALGTGACPSLESLDVHTQRQAGLELKVLAEALEARTALRLPSLTSLTLWPGTGESLEGIGRLLACAAAVPATPPKQSMRVDLRLRATQSMLAELAVQLRGAAVGGLRKLAILGVRSQNEVLPGVGRQQPYGSDVVLALVNDGLLAGMEELDLVDLRLSAPALTALYKSFSSSRCTMLTRLALNLINFESQDADDEATEVIAAAIPTNSNLQALTADDSASAAASAGAAAIKAVARSSTLPLPRLLLLGLTKRGDKHWILGAPRLLAGVEKLITWASQQYTKSAMQGLADALPAMPKLRHIKITATRIQERQAAADSIRPLASALSQSAVRGLCILELNWQSCGLALVLEAVAADACPKLSKLILKRVGPYEELPVRQCAALGSLLDGSAACSASLTVLDIKEAFWLNEFGFMVMASAMSGKPKGARLESLSFCYRGMHPDLAARGLTGNVSSLWDPRAGSRLSYLGILMLRPPPSPAPNGEDSAYAAALLVEALYAGAWPSMRSPEPLQLWEAKVDDPGRTRAVLGEEVYGPEYRARRAARMYGEQRGKKGRK